MAPMPATKNLMTPREAATYLSVSPRTLESWRNKLKGPPYRKIEGVIRYEQTDLEAWVADTAETGTP